MIGREDFVCTIGFEGNTAVVDGSLKRRYGRLSTSRLAEAGLFKQAFCSAIYAQENGGGTGEPEAVLEAYNRQARTPVGSVEELKRLFGVFEVPKGVVRVLVV